VVHLHVSMVFVLSVSMSVIVLYLLFVDFVHFSVTPVVVSYDTIKKIHLDV